MTEPTARSLRSELVETFVETGCTDRTSQEGADEFLARHRAVVLLEASALLGTAFWFDPRDREMAMNTLLDSIDPPPAGVSATQPTCGVLNPKVAATCTEPQDHPGPIHRDAFGNTWTRREGERPLTPR